MKKKEVLFNIIPLFLKTGYKFLTMDEIARSLSISKKTIYKFFTNKNELINSVNEEMVHYFDRLMKRKEPEAQNAVEFMFILRESVETIMSIESQKTFFEQKDVLDPAIAKKTLQVTRNVLYHLAHYTLEKTEREGLLNPNTDIHTTSFVFANNYVNLIINTKYQTEEEFRKTMRSWYYMHLRGPFNHRGNSIMDDYIERNPHLME